MNRGHGPDLAAARFRADSLRKLRAFFSERDVLEVETPVLSRGISLDCHIDVFTADFHPLGFSRPGSTPETFHLQTSPEPHMKRLLCRGFPDLYQIGKAFRNGERGGHHNPEFTMVEWYRRDFPLSRLMDEVEAVCLLISGSRPVVHKTYAEAFLEALALDPFTLDPKSLADIPALAGKLPEGHGFQTRSDALDYLMAHIVEPGLDPAALTFIREFPSEQAAQAQIHPQDPRVAYRFEVYGGGMELGNGYLELVDPVEYSERFDKENVKRRNAGKPELPKDRTLLEDLQRGLPPCAGVAMGFDRLLMLGLGSNDIRSVVAFPWETC
jgi:elongation factor P--(R)-beta-lysine ligase